MANKLPISKTKRSTQYVIFFGLQSENPARILEGVAKCLGVNVSGGTITTTTSTTTYTLTDLHVTVSHNSDPTHAEKSPEFEAAIKDSTVVDVTITAFAISETHIVAKVSLPEGTLYNGHECMHITIAVAAGAKPVDSPLLFTSSGEGVTIIDTSQDDLTLKMKYYAHCRWIKSS
jgi:hypothetical protein